MIEKSNAQAVATSVREVVVNFVFATLSISRYMYYTGREISRRYFSLHIALLILESTLPCFTVLSVSNYFFLLKIVFFIL
jgi:hypothetical protein